MRVAIGEQKSTNRQFHVYVCFKWRAVSEGERDRSSQIFSNFIKGLRSKIMQVCTGGSDFSNDFSTLEQYIILIAKTLSGILLVTQDDPLFCQNHAKSTSNPCCRQKYNLYQQTPRRPDFLITIAHFLISFASRVDSTQRYINAPCQLVSKTGNHFLVSSFLPTQTYVLHNST